MNWKNIRFVLLCLLLLLNVSLFIFNRYQEIRNYTVPQERIDGIRGLFEENGISINVSLNRKHDPKPWLKISLADEDTLSGIITSYFVDGFQKVYYVDNMMAQFTKDSEVFVMDYQNSSIAYTNQSNSEEDETVQSLSPVTPSDLQRNFGAVDKGGHGDDSGQRGAQETAGIMLR